MKVAVLLPGYNVAREIPAVLARIAAGARAAGADWTCVVVDDGSADETARAAADAGAVVLRHPVNRGKGAALSTGFAWAVAGGYDGVVTMDADGQHDPALIPALLAEAEASGSGIVIGNRMGRVGAMPPLRVWTNRTTSRLVSRLAGTPIADSQSGFRYIAAGVLKRVRLVSTRYDAESELLIKAGRLGFAITEVPVPSVYEGSESHINPVVDTGRFLRVMWLALFVWRNEASMSAAR